MIFGSIVVSVISVLLGLYSSIQYDIATGPAIVITLGFIFVLSQLIPKRG
jgi:zinc transport system permease protein